MYTHNLDPVLLNIGFLSIRWYSLAYIFGIILGWIYAKKLIEKIINKTFYKFNSQDFDDYISYLIFSIIIGGRVGYVMFYNFEYYSQNLLEILKIWKGGMSFHGALIGIILGTFIFANKRKLRAFVFLDLVACTAPIGIFFGRISNFINSELYGKPTGSSWGVVFPNIDNVLRHPSQIYEAILEGLFLFIILNTIIFLKKYSLSFCSSMFLIFYGFFRIVAEQYRVPDQQLDMILDFISIGSLLSSLMIIAGFILIFFKNKFNERNI